MIDEIELTGTIYSKSCDIFIVLCIILLKTTKKTAVYITQEIKELMKQRIIDVHDSNFRSQAKMFTFINALDSPHDIK